MAAFTSSTPSNIYLAKHNGELVLRQGENPNKFKHADERVLVVGGGVTGLTVRVCLQMSLILTDASAKNAWALLDAGYSVTVASDRWASLENRITSQIAGAL